MSKEPTPDELRSAAEERQANSQTAPPLGQSVASYVSKSGSRTRAKSVLTHTATSRVTEEMAESIGSRANSWGMNASDAVRKLLTIGIEHSEEENQ